MRRPVAKAWERLIRASRLCAALCLLAVSVFAQNQELATLTTADRPELLEDIAGIGIGAFLLAFGFAAVALAASRREQWNRSLLFFGIFCGLYGLRLIGNADLLHFAVGLPRSFWSYQDAFITYLIPLPAWLSTELLLGQGWTSSIRAIRRLQVAYAAIAIVIDSIWGPGVARGPNAFLVILGMGVCVANGLRAVLRKEVRLDWETGPVIAGLLFFVLLALNTNLVDKRLVPWRFSFEPLGMLVFVSCLGYVIVQRFFKNEQKLLAVTYELRESALRAEAAEAERRRQAEELEEARQLQLSMLPRTLPQLPHLEIAAYMQTATEVGGDYYDFHLGEDGTLTIAVGDATGHGLKAGMMVTAVKSLFETLAPDPDIAEIFRRKSRALKRMNLRGLFMALTMVKLSGHRLTLSIAGMPPVLIYRAARGEVEEIAIRAVPLGGVAGYPYRQQELPVAAGDIVVLMSDGLPERFNAENEMLDYAATKRALAEAADRSPQQIIEHFVRVGEAWANGRAQDDDMTFVVLKVKG